MRSLVADFGQCFCVFFSPLSISSSPPPSPSSLSLSLSFSPKAALAAALHTWIEEHQHILALQRFLKMWRTRELLLAWNGWVEARQTQKTHRVILQRFCFFFRGFWCVYCTRLFWSLCSTLGLCLEWLSWCAAYSEKAPSHIYVYLYMIGAYMYT